MNNMVMLGFFMALFAGACAGGAATPIKLMRHFKYEHWSFIAAMTGMVVLPWLVMLLFCPDVFTALGTVTGSTLLKANLLSMSWGIANVLCGLCLVRIGFSLTVGLLTGVGLPIGVLLPMVFRGSGQFADAPGLFTRSGLVIGLGVAVMMVAVVLISQAGFGRDAQQKNAVTTGAKVEPGRFRTGLVMAVIAGFLQVGLSFAFVYTQAPINEALRSHGAGVTAAGVGIWAVTMPGGALINLGFAAFLMIRNRSWPVLTSAPKEILLSLLIGIIFLTFLVSMGTSMRWLGVLGASVGFAVYQMAQICTSQAVGFISGEWHGITGKPRAQMLRAIAMLIIAVVIIASGRSV